MLIICTFHPLQKEGGRLERWIIPQQMSLLSHIIDKKTQRVVQVSLGCYHGQHLLKADQK